MRTNNNSVYLPQILIRKLESRDDVSGPSIPVGNIFGLVFQLTNRCATNILVFDLDFPTPWARQSTVRECTALPMALICLSMLSLALIGPLRKSNVPMNGPRFL